jgi:hypothetical protein
MNSDTLALNPDLRVLEEKSKKFSLIKDDLALNLRGRNFKPPISIKREGNSVEDAVKVAEYNAISNYFGMNPLKLNDLKKQ